MRLISSPRDFCRLFTFAKYHTKCFINIGCNLSGLATSSQAAVLGCKKAIRVHFHSQQYMLLQARCAHAFFSRCTTTLKEPVTSGWSLMLAW